MEWIKIPTDNILYSEFTDSELIALIKYQALYCQIENEPSIAQLRRILNARQLKFVQSNSQVAQELITNQIKVVKTKRNRDKESYERKQGLNENSASGKTTLSKLTSVTDKTRLDKIRKEDTKVSKKNKLQEFKDWDYSKDEKFMNWLKEKAKSEPAYKQFFTKQILNDVKENLEIEIEDGNKRKYKDFNLVFKKWIKNKCEWELQRGNR